MFYTIFCQKCLLKRLDTTQNVWKKEKQKSWLVSRHVFQGRRKHLESGWAETLKWKLRYVFYTIFCQKMGGQMSGKKEKQKTQWIFLLYRRLQKIEQVKPDHCDRYQNNRNKNCNWMALVSYIGNCGNISQISLKCRKSLNLVKLLKSWQFIISLKTFGGLINYFK